MKTVKNLKLRMQSIGLALRGSRRGSFLVLVVGTLAMLSIIMIVYVAVGSADKRTSASIARRDRSDDVISGFSDYVAQIIADDAVTVVPDASNAKPDGSQTYPVAGGNLYVREAWDAPTTSWMADSTVDPSTTTATQVVKVFRPVGLGDDPWLASTTPTWINYNPSSVAGATNFPNNGSLKTFAKRRDWLHITNIAPDGRFINLYNLRDNFDAKPGTALSDSTGRPRLNANLSLLDVNSGPSQQPVWGGGVSLDIPSFFDSWQQNAFRPAKGPFKIGGIDMLQSPTNAKDYPPYQWADADGDGWLDSRWFEMTDARGSSNPAAPGDYRNLLPSDPNYRWFFAARIIDLSSLVNVNAAGDMGGNPNVSGSTAATMPRKLDVVGLSPGDIDLRRLLQMRDFSETVFDQPLGTPPMTFDISDVLANGNPVNPPRSYEGGYGAIHQPLNSFPLSQDYSCYVTDFTKAAAGASKQNLTISFPVLASVKTNVAVQVGEGAYRSLRGSVWNGAPTGRFSDFTIDPLLTQGVFFQTIRDRSTSYNTIAAPMDRAVYDPASTHFLTGTGFRVDSLIELLTFRGVNDHRVTSSLELAMGGHFDYLQGTTGSPGQAPKFSDPANPLSPMRENRWTELEREHLAARDGTITEAALLKSYTDVRQYLTTDSGARPIIPAFNLTTAKINLDHPPALTTADLASYIGDNSATNGLDGAAMFKGYAAALAPGLGIPGAWKKPDPGTDARSLRGLFYGHQGPLTALLAAGQMAANFASSGKSATATSKHLPYTLVLTEDVFQNASDKLPENIDYTNSPGSGYTSWQKYFPGWWVGKQYQLNLGRSPTNSPRVGTLKLSESPTIDPVPAPAVNLYGMSDVHPFLVEVASFTLYRDAMPADAAGIYTKVEADIEMDVNRQANVTIRGNIVKDNDDFMFRVFAVKLHNPYAQAIQLSSFTPGTAGVSTDNASTVVVNNLSDFFYVRVGSSKADGARYYVLAEADETRTDANATSPFSGEFIMRPLVIQPGETLVLYALSEDSKTVSIQRINRTTRLGTVPTQDDPLLLDRWLTKQLGPVAKSAPNSIRRVRMVMADDSFESSTPQSSAATFKFDQLVPDHGKDQTVSLFQCVRAKTGTGGVSDDGANFNATSNDRLCDRMRLGTDINLDRQLISRDPTRLKSSQYDNSISIVGLPVDTRPQSPYYDWPRPPQNGKLFNQTLPGPTYNGRFTVTLAAHATRKADPDGANLKVGQLPAWAIDPKDEPATSWYAPDLKPAQSNSDALKLDAGTTDVATTRAYASYSDIIWKEDLLADTVPPIYESLPIRPESRSDNVLAAKNKNSEDFVSIRREFASNGLGYQGVDASGAASDGVSQARLGDLLSVMAVGACEVPVSSTGVEITAAESRWTTTAEALAIAFNYSDRANFDDWTQGGSKYGPLDYFMFNHATATPPKSLFDGGYLKTDDFIAGRYDRSDDTKFYPSSIGAPIAGGVLSALKTRSDGFAGLTMPAAGLVNINTAPQPVLRVLPFLFPSKDEITGKVFWVDAGSDPTDDAAARKTDIAAMLESYRDKIRVELRPGARPPQLPEAKAWFAPFFDRSQAEFASGAGVTPPNSPLIGDPTQTTVYGGRYWTSGIKGIREGAGFHSPAELFGVRAVDFNPADGSIASNADLPSNIDSLGARGADKPTLMLGTDNNVEQVLDLSDPSKPKITDIKPLQFGHTYQDKLKVISGLMGSISVRSDMYAVWFVARGYQRSDVEGIPTNQPMVPSIERRFLMIIDRSNVTKVGQKPRVMAFVELPL